MSPLPQDVDEASALAGGMANGGAIDPDGRLLSVAEIQQALRELRARRPRAASRLAAPPEHLVCECPAPAGTPGPPAGPWRRDDGETAPPPQRGASGGDSVPAAATGGGDSDALAADWITVVAAHAGAGASTVALAISDAAAATGRRVHLVESVHPHRSGLVAAASAELGTDATGGWRRGSRGRVTIDRRVADVAPGGWPVLPVGEEPAVTVLDLGLPAPVNLARLAADRSRTVVVCRPTVPGVRLVEHVLSQLAEQPVVVAAVGPRRWSGEVTASLGLRLRALRAAARVVTVPADRRLEVTGPTPGPLPKPVRAAARALLGLLEDADPRAAAASPPSAPTRRGTRR